MSAVRCFLLLLLCLSLSPPLSRSATEAEALLAFKSSLSIPPDKLTSWTQGSQPCEDKWEGIFCIQGKPIIFRLHLQHLGLSGSVDVDSLTQIKNLRTLSLSNNNFSGPLPPFNKLTKLRALYASDNQFSGEIPDDFFNGSTLRRIWLSDNAFTGNIPGSLETITGLQALHLEGNKFSGPIPEFPQKSLTELNVSSNQLEGKIPASMERFGADAFKGNPGVCGKIVGTECSGQGAAVGGSQQGSQPAGGHDDASGNNTKSTVFVVVGIVVGMVVLLIVVNMRKSKDNDESFSVLGKEPVDDVVEVHVHGQRSSASGGGGGGGDDDSGGGGSKHNSSGGGSTKRSSVDSSSSHKKGSDHGSKKGAQNGKNGMGDLVVINEEKGVFGLADLMKAAAEVLGNGGLGSAYKAVMSNGVSVVVKRIRDMNNLGKEEFDAEIRRIGRLRHKNILTPLAYHYRKEEKLVVSEYISRGSLLYVLHGMR